MLAELNITPVSDSDVEQPDSSAYCDVMRAGCILFLLNAIQTTAEGFLFGSDLEAESGPSLLNSQIGSRKPAL